MASADCPPAGMSPIAWESVRPAAGIAACAAPLSTSRASTASTSTGEPSPNHTGLLCQGWPGRHRPALDHFGPSTIADTNATTSSGMPMSSASTASVPGFCDASEVAVSTRSSTRSTVATRPRPRVADPRHQHDPPTRRSAAHRCHQPSEVLRLHQILQQHGVTLGVRQRQSPVGILLVSPRLVLRLQVADGIR